MKDIAEAIKAAPGLDGSEADSVAGETTDPTLKAHTKRKKLSARADKARPGKTR